MNTDIKKVLGDATIWPNKKAKVCKCKSGDTYYEATIPVEEVEIIRHIRKMEHYYNHNSSDMTKLLELLDNFGQMKYEDGSNEAQEV